MRNLFYWAACSFGLMCIGSLCALYLVKRQRRITSTIALSLGTFAGIGVLLFAVETAREFASGYDLAQAIKPHNDVTKPFYSVGQYDQTLPFYLQRSITLVDYRGRGEKDLDFGQSQEPNKSLPDVNAFQQAWSRSPTGSIAAIKPQTYDELVKQQVPMTVIGKNTNLIAVIKP